MTALLPGWSIQPDIQHKTRNILALWTSNIAAPRAFWGGGLTLRLYLIHVYFKNLAGRSGDRIPVGARFSAPVQTDPGAHPASYTMGTGSFLRVKRPGRGVDHPPLSSAVCVLHCSAVVPKHVGAVLMSILMYNLILFFLRQLAVHQLVNK
jgi:hypothetical protein